MYQVGRNSIKSQIHRHTVLTLGIGIVFIGQLLTVHVLKKVHPMLALKSSTVYHQISEVL
jgi:hypothetical protein